MLLAAKGGGKSRTRTRHYVSFFGALAKLRNATIRFIQPLCRSVYPLVQVERLSSHWMDFHEIRYFSYLKIFRKY
jgi:hypothetical protein